jgi:hypothetical protein
MPLRAATGGEPQFTATPPPSVAPTVVARRHAADLGAAIGVGLHHED